MSTIPVAFLSHATSVLASSENGMSGSKIVEFCNAWAADHGVDTPHAIYPFKAGNKRTALLENLRAFPAVVQYRMLLDLCDLAGPARAEVQQIRATLVQRFGASFPPVALADPQDDYAVLQLLGVSGANSYPPQSKQTLTLGRLSSSVTRQKISRPHATFTRASRPMGSSPGWTK